MNIKTFSPLFLLLVLSVSVSASPVTYPGAGATDTAGVAVTSGLTASVASVTDLDGNAVATPGAVAHTAGGNTSVVYDTAAKGEAWVTLTLTATGHTFNPVVIFCSSDPNSISTAATSAAKIGTNTGDSPNAVTAQSAVNTTGTAVTALPANTSTAVWGAATKTVTGGTVTTVTNAVVLPTTPPTGYGGSTGDTPGTTSLLAKIGTPAGASLSADVAAVKSDTGSLVTNVASLPAANATAVWGSTTRALTDKANFALVSTEYANIAAVTTTYGFDGPPAGTILTLTITRNSSSQPVLTWTADPAATLYKVYRSTDGANYTVIATPATGTLTYTDTARPAGATVYYHITSTH